MMVITMKLLFNNIWIDTLLLIKFVHIFNRIESFFINILETI